MQPHSLLTKGGRSGIAVFPCIQGEPAILIRSCSCVKRRIKRHRRKRKKCGFVLLKQLGDETAIVIIVMFPLHVLITCYKEILILFGQGIESGNRDEFIAPQISDLILDVPFFPARFGIHEYRPEPVVLTETLGTFGDNGSGIIKPDLRGYTANVPKHRNQPFQKTLHIFTIVELEIPAVTVWKAEDKIFRLVVQPAVLVKVCISKVSLCLSGMVFKRKIAFLQNGRDAERAD